MIHVKKCRECSNIIVSRNHSICRACYSKHQTAICVYCNAQHIGKYLCCQKCYVYLTGKDCETCGKRFLNNSIDCQDCYMKKNMNENSFLKTFKVTKILKRTKKL